MAFSSPVDRACNMPFQKLCIYMFKFLAGSSWQKERSPEVHRTERKTKEKT